MLKALFSRKIRNRDAQNLYGTVVAYARSPHLYTTLGVPDTFDGRFEMLTMCLYALDAYLRKHGSEARQLSQNVFDVFIADMDAALREAAVGDQSVPKKLAKMTRVVHGRASAYDRALNEGSESALAVVVARNTFNQEEVDERARALASEMMRIRECLDAIPPSDFLADPRFPEPAGRGNRNEHSIS